jgi:hypothetical protein
MIGLPLAALGGEVAWGGDLPGRLTGQTCCPLFARLEVPAGRPSRGIVACRRGRALVSSSSLGGGSLSHDSHRSRGSGSRSSHEAGHRQ